MSADKASSSPNIITLHAGELIFGKGQQIVKTLLGSCVAVTLFHPSRKLAGICHFALPSPKRSSGKVTDPRYADNCFLLFARHAKKHSIVLSEFDAHIVGGGNMLDTQVNVAVEDGEKGTIGERNARTALLLATQYGVNVISIDVGEFGYRQLQFNTANGELNVCFTRTKNHNLATK